MLAEFRVKWPRRWIPDASAVWRQYPRPDGSPKRLWIFTRVQVYLPNTRISAYLEALLTPLTEAATMRTGPKNVTQPNRGD